MNHKLLRVFIFAAFLSVTFQSVEAAPVPKKNDRIGWSADGNKVDPDDWGASAMALAIFTKQGWQNKLVHIDYNNRLNGALYFFTENRDCKNLAMAIFVNGILLTG